MNQATRQGLAAGFFTLGALLNLVAGLGAPYPGVFVLIGIAALSIGVGFYRSTRQ